MEVFYFTVQINLGSLSVFLFTIFEMLRTAEVWVPNVLLYCKIHITPFVHPMYKCFVLNDELYIHMLKLK